CDVSESCTGSSAACPEDTFKPSTVECRAAAGDCDLAERCTGADAACPPDAKSTAVCRLARGECDLAESCDGVGNDCPPDAPSTPHADQAASDADGIGDACAPCNDAEAAPLIRPALKLGKRGDATSGSLKLRGGMKLAYPYAPAIDPLRKGIRILVEDAQTGRLIDAIIPGGPFNPATKAGWKVNKAHNLWVYRNVGRAVAPVEGITKITLKDLSSTKPGYLTISVVGKRGMRGRVHLPLRVTLVLDSPMALTGQCSEGLFAGPSPAPACVSRTDGV